MAAVESSSNLVELIHKLEMQKAQHAEMAAAVTTTLGQISGLLGALIGGQQRPAVSHTAPKAAPKAAPRAAIAPKAFKAPSMPATKASSTPAVANRNKFALTGDESVLAFIKRRGNPSTSEVQAHWSSEGRGSSADNSLSKLHRDKKIKREANKQGRGSRYTVA